MTFDNATWPQPIHVVYGGANLFSANTVEKLGRIALDTAEKYAADENDWAEIFSLDGAVATAIRERVVARLRARPIEDFRIDLEDGYGIRSDAEEDADAIRVADETADALAEDRLPTYFGLRVKSFAGETRVRAEQSLRLYLEQLGRRGKGLPANFCVTLPKVSATAEVDAFVRLIDELESEIGFDAGSIAIEIMVETPRALIASDGTFALPQLVAAAQGRCRGAHFGAYDHTASLGITSSSQDLFHQACDFARNIMQVTLAGTGVWLSDGATNIMPVSVHRGEGLSDEQTAENRDTVRRGLRIHYDNCRRSLDNGYYQGWDLHPAQIPARLAAINAFYTENIDDASRRLKSFVERATKASMVGAKFDDAATGEGLLNFFLRGVGCGAIDEGDISLRTGLSLGELQTGSFEKIARARMSA